MPVSQHHKKTKNPLHLADHGTQEYLVFVLGLQEYGIDTHIVQELRKYEAVTAVANAPAYVMGVINLRGMTVPIIDLRIRLGMEPHAYDQFTVVIILNSGQHYVGIIVDGIADVIAPDTDQIEAATQLDQVSKTSYFKHMSNMDNRKILLTNIDHLINSEELSRIEKIAA